MIFDACIIWLRPITCHQRCRYWVISKRVPSWSKDLCWYKDPFSVWAAEANASWTMITNEREKLKACAIHNHLDTNEPAMCGGALCWLSFCQSINMFGLWWQVYCCYVGPWTIRDAVVSDAGMAVVRGSGIYGVCRFDVFNGVPQVWGTTLSVVLRRASRHEEDLTNWKGRTSSSIVTLK